MSVVPYSYVRLQQLSSAEIQRIAREQGLVGTENKQVLINRILDWQAGHNPPPRKPFSAGLLLGPILEIVAQLEDYYDLKNEVAELLGELSAPAFEAVLKQIHELPALPTSSMGLRISYLLMYDLLKVGRIAGESTVARATRKLYSYFQRKDEIIRLLKDLTDAALFTVVDEVGSDLRLANPYVQINGIRYQNNLEVIYYLVTLRSR